MLLMPIWHPIANLPGYEACPATGEIRNAATGRTLQPVLSKSSCRYYARVNLHGKTRLVHRLIVAAQLGRPLAREEQVRHLDGNPGNNRAEALCIGSAKANALDRIAHGTNGRRLQANHVREIRMLASRRSTRQLADAYGVTPGHIRAIMTGQRWAGLPT